MYFMVASTKSSTGMPHHLPVHMLALRSKQTTSRYFLYANHRTDFGDTSSTEPKPEPEPEPEPELAAVGAAATPAAAAVAEETSPPPPPLPMPPAPRMPSLLLFLSRRGVPVGVAAPAAGTPMASARLDP